MVSQGLLLPLGGNWKLDCKRPPLRGILVPILRCYHKGDVIVAVSNFFPQRLLGAISSLPG